MKDYTMYRFNDFENRGKFIKFLIDAYGKIGYADLYDIEKDCVYINLEFGKMLIEFKQDINEIHVYNIKEGK